MKEERTLQMAPPGRHNTSSCKLNISWLELAYLHETLLIHLTILYPTFLLLNEKVHPVLELYTRVVTCILVIPTTQMAMTVALIETLVLAEWYL